jgi:hypothetical protein
VAARHGQGWATYGPTFEPGEAEGSTAAAQEAWWTGLAGMVDQLREIAGRLAPSGVVPDLYLNLDGAPVFSLTSADTLVEGVERAADLGFTDVVVHWPRAEGIYAGSEDVLEEGLSRLGR